MKELLLLLLLLVANHGAHPFCTTSVDCAMNGECVTAGKRGKKKCRCFQGWKGRNCEELDLLPVKDEQMGLKLPNRTSTWGGAITHHNGTWHMFASQLVSKCGLECWTSNSQVVRATSKHYLGPYSIQDIILEPFAHEPSILIAPTGEIVLLVLAQEGVEPRDCTDNPPPLHSPPLTRPTPRNTYMMWSNQPEGPWSDPVLVFNSTIWNSDYWSRYNVTTECDSNLNGIILPNGTLLGLWRRCETPDLHTIPHVIVASNWKDPSTYQPRTDPIFVLGGAGTEDPSNIWTTTTKDMGTAYHALFHDEQYTRCMEPTGCSANGRHAFSLNGISWRYSSVDAYGADVNFTTATGKSYVRHVTGARARPHVVLNDRNEPVALSTGFQQHQESGYVWTCVQELRQKKGLENDQGLQLEKRG